MEFPQPQSPEFAQRRRDHGSRVLVVEDVHVTQEFLKAILLDGGYQVTLASTAGEAQQNLQVELPDLVLLDLGLPDFNGLEVCRFLRTLEGGEDIPVLIITVDERPGSHAEAVRAGADDFLRKPLLPAELQTRTRSLLRLRHLRAELRRDREAILTLQAQKDHMVQFVVHDLKNLLGSLLGSVDLMETASPSESMRHRQRIKDTTRSMHDMVQSMLDLTMHEQGGFLPQPEPIALEPWLTQMHLELETLIQRRCQPLTLEVEPGLTIMADPQMLQRVIFNLLENASKFGPVGSRIEVTAGRCGSAVRIQVQDLGPGIPEDMKLRVFERFMRLDSGTTATPGQGLGLAFCRLVMDLHAGRIWVEDNAPCGSRFLLEFPG